MRCRRAGVHTHTQDWDSFPDGRWGNSRSAAYGALSDHQFLRRHTRNEAGRAKALAAWGAQLGSAEDVKGVFVKWVPCQDNKPKPVYVPV